MTAPINDVLWPARSLKMTAKPEISWATIDGWEEWLPLHGKSNCAATYYPEQT